MMTDQQRVWAKAKTEVLAITDRLGSPVDKGIVDTVVAMRLLGFNTTASCAGHIRRMNTGPYVIFELPKARDYAKRARVINDSHDPNFRALRKLANRQRAIDLGRMLTYLDEFYQNRLVNQSGRLIVQSMPMTLNILQCQGAEAAYAVNADTKKAILAHNQAEMRAFTDFLRQKLS
jgi:hypothetical protein